MARFGTDRRLRKPREFKATFAHGGRLSGKFLSVVVANATGGRARLGLAISKRSVRTAVGRNRIKRQIRESFRLHLDGLPAVDLVFSARHGAAMADNAQLRRELEQLWERIRERCGMS